MNTCSRPTHAEDSAPTEYAENVLRHERLTLARNKAKKIIARVKGSKRDAERLAKLNISHHEIAIALGCTEERVRMLLT